MAHRTPLRSSHESAGAALRAYGPPEAGIELVEAFDPIEVEYAAIRKHAAVLDLPSRGTLEVRGADRVGFLNRMVTQELKGLAAWEVRRSFWLNRKGRIDADLRLIELGDRTIVDVDAHAAGRAASGLASFLFSEDVQIEDRTEAWHRVALHGRGGPGLLARIGEPAGGAAAGDLGIGRACLVKIAGREVIVDRQDSAGEVGLELLVRAGDAAAVYDAISEPTPEGSSTGATRSMDGQTGLARRIGWHAYNIARIEAGWPIYNIDFGPDSLPHETGVLDDRVSFKKGCYLGQEVVARMHSLGHPKQKLVGLKILDEERASRGEARLPETGAPIFATEGPVADKPPEVVGAVTSSAISPMLAATPVALAMVKYKHIAAGTKLFVEAEGAVLPCVVQEGLAFWKPERG